MNHAARSILTLLLFLMCSSPQLTLAQSGRESNLRILESSGLTAANNFVVNLQLGNDGARGGSQILLAIKTQGGYRRFDLNRSRTEWGPRHEQSLRIDVIPAIPYAEILQVGIEFHGSQGDLTQEQDDADFIKFVVTTEHSDGKVVSIGGFQPNVHRGTPIENPVRLENDNTHWMTPALTLNVSYCQNDTQCDDGLYCNGIERCGPRQAGADARGCLVGAPPCTGAQACNEEIQRCDTACRDNDGDGFQSARCGGDDCDDNDANRYPGNVEVYDTADHDEDCDVTTHGIYRGASATQICDGANGVVLVDATETFTRARCTTGTVCVQQPNGSGVCMPQPEMYQAPGAATLPRGNQAAPPDPLENKRNAARNRDSMTMNPPATRMPMPTTPPSTLPVPKSKTDAESGKKASK